MGKIVTITLNPSIDKSTTVKNLVPEQKLRCTNPKYEPGGGGINVSRAIKQLGGNSLALFLAGGHMGNLFIDLIKEQHLEYGIVEIEGQTRENVIVVDTSSNNQYRFGMEGPEVKEKEWEQCLSILEKIDDIDYLVASGSLSPGIPSDFYGRIAKIAKKKKSRFVLDTSGEALKIAANEGVFLLKPNLGELSSLAGVDELHLDMVDEKAMEIIDKGSCEVVVVSLGAAGALLVSKEKTAQIPNPPVMKQSTVGAGDSMVGGIVLKLHEGWDIWDAARYGVASGTSATMNPGTELCHKKDADQLFEWIKEHTLVG